MGLAGFGNESSGDDAQTARPGSVGGWLRVFRERSGLSLAALATRTGLGVTTLKALEHDRRQRPHSHTLVLLADALGASAAERALLLDVARGASSRPEDPPQQDFEQAPASSGRWVRLPFVSASPIGREVEIAHARALVDPASGSVRLLTMVGPAGVGKTRLALAVAGSLLDDYPNGVAFVDLGGLRDARLVPATIAHALDVREAGGRSAREHLLERLRDEQVLLVLDNFEHLLAATPLVAELLVSCPHLVLLVTSRTALRLHQERRFVVPPLATPDPDQTLEVIAASPAVQLFVERAEAAAPDFRLKRSTASAIAQICIRLDGLPLSIELAAARAGLLGPDALLQRLEQRLPLLTVAATDLPARQRTLRDTLTWSYDLLGSSEQLVFRRLAVFVDGWTLEAAEAVIGNDDDTLRAGVLDDLQMLVDSSLVHRVPDEASRFQMLGTVHEYAVGCLSDSGEQAAVRNRHFHYYLSLAEQATPLFFGRQLADVLAALERDLGNLRAALDWACAQGQTAHGLRLAGALAPFWNTRGYAGEGLAWLNRLIADMPSAQVPAVVAARALFGAGVLANSHGDQPQAIASLDCAVALYREAGDRVGAVRALNTRGGVDYDRGDLERALDQYRQCVSLAREADDLGEVARALANLAEVQYYLDDLDQASVCQEEALDLARKSGRIDVEGYVLSDAGNVARRLGDFGSAMRLHRQALTLKRMLGDTRRTAISLEDMGALAVAQVQMLRAARLLGAASRLRAQIGTPLPVPEMEAVEQTAAAARAALGEAEWTIAFSAGTVTPLEDVIVEALGENIPGVVGSSG